MIFRQPGGRLLERGNAGAILDWGLNAVAINRMDRVDYLERPNPREGCLNPSRSQMSCRATPIAVAKLLPSGWSLNPERVALGGNVRPITVRSYAL